MSRNIEIKARVEDRPAVEARAAALSTSRPTVIVQDDTFYSAPTGRLKLRRFSDGLGELIAYTRADASASKLSTYEIATVADPDALARVLDAALIPTGRVIKRRTLYLSGRTRIHLDEVEGLGHYLELEVVLEATESLTRAQDEAQTLMEALEVRPDDLVSGSYLDLLRSSEQGT